MPVNAGLINGQIPLAGAPAPAPMQQLDPMGGYSKGLDLANKESAVREQITARKEEETDNYTLRQMLDSGQYDLSSPEGMDKVIKDGMGSLSPSGMMKLVAHKQDIQKQADQHKEAISKLNTEALQQEVSKSNLTAELTAWPVSQYDAAKSAGASEDQAQQVYKQALAQSLARAGDAKTPDGQPMVDVQKLGAFANMPVAALRQHAFGSKYMGAVVEQRLKVAQTAAAEARTREATKSYQDPATGDVYRKADGGGWEVQTGENTWIPASKIPDNMHEVGKGSSTHYIALSAHDGGTYRRPVDGGPIEKYENGKWTPAPGMENKVWPSKNDKESKDVKYSQDELRTAIVQYYSGGKVSVKLSSSPQFLEAAQIYKHQTGMSDEDLALLSKDQKTGEAALRNLKQTYGQVKAIEGQVEFNAKNALAILQKVHPDQLTDMPALNKLILAGEKNFTGYGKDVASLGIALDGLLKEYAKISTGSLGNTPTAENEIKIAREMLNAARTKEDLTATIEYIQKEAKEGRLGSVEESIRTTRESMRMPSGGGSSASSAARDTRGEGKISPAQQRANDSDRPRILSEEYSKAKSQEDRAAVQRELKSIGWTLRQDPKGNKAFVSPDGKSFVEVK
jgi:hypothetical protein